jgi:hypothetical protein
MIKFELANASGNNSDDAMVYLPGQNYAMFCGVQFRFDRVLQPNEDWVGCIFDGKPNGSIHFIECKPNKQFIVHTAELISTDDKGETTKEDVVEWTLENEKKLSSMRLTQAAILLKSVRRASESMDDIVRLISSFDREMENQFPNGGGVKLGIHDFIRKSKDAVSLDNMNKTLCMVENESIEIMHEELDIPHSPFKRSRH